MAATTTNIAATAAAVANVGVVLKEAKAAAIAGFLLLSSPSSLSYYIYILLTKRLKAAFSWSYWHHPGG